jgi:hypothetical protein
LNVMFRIKKIKEKEGKVVALSCSDHIDWGFAFPRGHVQCFRDS